MWINSYLCVPFTDFEYYKRWKELINPRPGKERTNTAFVREWQPKVAVAYWLVAGLKVARNWPFLTRRGWNNSCYFNLRHIVSQLPNGFSKAERLNSRKLIDTLFQEGASFKEYPLKFLWTPTTSGSVPAQICVAVPKKRISHATDRNRIKRLLRESYRTQKGLLYQYLQEKNSSLVFMVIYMGKENPEFSTIETAMNKGLLQLIQAHEKYQQAG